MKTPITSAFIALLSIAALASCSEDDNVTNEPKTPQVVATTNTPQGATPTGTTTGTGTSTGTGTTTETGTSGQASNTARFMNGTGSATGQGTVTYAQNGGNFTLTFGSDFQVSSGPDLEVYLSKEKDHPVTSYKFAKLKSTSGEQSYTLAITPNIAEYKYVLVYCTPYKHLFAYAELTQ